MVSRSDVTSVARHETVQPSLWDRLVDDLPGISAEHDALLRDLTKAIGDAGGVEAMIAGSPIRELIP